MFTWEKKVFHWIIQVKIRGGLDAHADSNDRHAGTAPTRYVKRPGMGVRALVFDVIELLVGSLCTFTVSLTHESLIWYFLYHSYCNDVKYVNIFDSYAGDTVAPVVF